MRHHPLNITEDIKSGDSKWEVIGDRVIRRYKHTERPEGVWPEVLSNSSYSINSNSSYHTIILATITIDIIATITIHRIATITINMIATITIHRIATNTT